MQVKALTMPGMFRTPVVGSSTDSESVCSHSLVFSSWYSSPVWCGLCLSTKVFFNEHDERLTRITTNKMIKYHSNFLFILVIYTNTKNCDVCYALLGFLEAFCDLTFVRPILDHILLCATRTDLYLCTKMSLQLLLFGCSLLFCYCFVYCF